MLCRIASIDFKPPFILSGSSDRHLRLFDATTLKGWSTTREGTLLETPRPQVAATGLSATTVNGPNNTPFHFDSELLSGVLTDDDADDDGDVELATRPCSCPCPSSCFCTRPSSSSSEQAVKMVCRGCGSNDVGTLHARNMPSSQALSAEHKDLVRSVVLGERFVVSGSYDKTIKVWDRHTGTLVADLAGGHIGRILCVAFDKTKIVSCGEDYVCFSCHDRITDVIDGYLPANMCLGFRPWS